MIKAKFIGDPNNLNSADILESKRRYGSFLKNGRIYYIQDSHIARLDGIDYEPEYLYVTFYSEAGVCPNCGAPVDRDFPSERRDIPYRSIESFAKDWEVIYD